MSRRPLLVPLVVLLGLALGALGSSLRPRPPAAVPGGGGPGPSLPAPVALGGGRALLALGSRTEALQVQQVSARDGRVALGWTWLGPPGRTEWSQRGPLVAAQRQGAQGRRSLELFDVERGHVASVPTTSAWCFAGDGVAAVVSTGGGVADVALLTSGHPRWTTRLPTSRGLRLAATHARVVALVRGHAWALELADGALTDLGELDDVVGLVPADEVLVAQRGPRVVALPLAAPRAPLPIDLTGGVPLLEGGRFVPPRPPGTSPRLLGRHAGRWIIAYATETPTDPESNEEPWRTPATQHLAAVEAASGLIAWRRTLGPLEVTSEPACGDDLAADLLVLGWTEDEAHERAFWLGSVTLTDGAVRWSTTWPAKGYSADPLLLRRGEATYLVAQGLDFRTLIARFSGGRLTGGLRGTPAMGVSHLALDPDEVWAFDRGRLVRLAAPSLAGLPPDPALPGDVLAGIADRLGLPPSAR